MSADGDGPAAPGQTRRQFLRGMAGTTAALALPQRTPLERPNILLFLSDDHGVFESGCYGNRAVKTPNIDALAAQGMRFENVYTSTSICTPSRSMLYTGLYPHHNGSLANNHSIREGVETLPHHLGALGYAVAIAGKKHVSPSSAFPFEEMGEQNLKNFLRTEAKRDRPFCLVFSTPRPHRPYPKTPQFDPKRVAVPPFLIDTPVTRHELAGYYDLIEAMDRNLGNCVHLLEKHGLAEQTLFIYASDHGNAMPFCKYTLYEAGMKVPWIARMPGLIEPGTVSDALVNFVDFVPTLLDLCGGPAKAKLDGTSFLPVLSGDRREHRDAIFGVIADPSQGARARSVRDATHKYIVNLDSDELVTTPFSGEGQRYGDVYESWTVRASFQPSILARVARYRRRPAEELYDLTSDPHELHDLAGDPANRPRMDAMRATLRGWAEAQGDPAARSL